MRIDHPLGNQPPPVIPRGGRPLRNYRHTGEGRYPGTMREGRQLSNIAISHPSQPSLSRGNRLRKNLRRRESTDAMKRKCGQTRQSNSETTARPMRHVSDTNKLLSATIMAASSYGRKTLRGPLLLMKHTMSQCDPSWTDTTMSQMSHPPDTKNSFADTTGVPSQLQDCPPKRHKCRPTPGHGAPYPPAPAP